MNLTELVKQEVFLNTLCFIWFFTCWFGYTLYARKKAMSHSCLASELHSYRQLWMRRVMLRDVRVSDSTLIANLERNVSFLASTSILILAGLLTVLTVSDELSELISHIPFSSHSSTLSIQLKVGLLVMIFVYTFFTFTWSMRQYGFSSIMLGAAPMASESSITTEEREQYAYYSARIIDLAGLSYNYGLRAYYFALSVLAWFVNPYFFILTCGFVVAVLYRREFKSRSLMALKHVENKSEHPLNM